MEFHRFLAIKSPPFYYAWWKNGGEMAKRNEDMSKERENFSLIVVVFLKTLPCSLDLLTTRTLN